MLELCVMQSTASLQLLPGPLGSGVVEPNRVISMDHIELTDICSQVHLGPEW